MPERLAGCLAGKSGRSYNLPAETGASLENDMSDRLKALRGFAAPLCAGVFASLVIVPPAFPASHEQIVEACKQAVMPQFHTCVVDKVGKPKFAPEDALQKAREQCGAVLVRPCVMREEQKQAAGVAAPAAPKDETAVAPSDATSVQTIFVAPPRTIADITAILDSEKPDEAKIAARKAKADATPPNNLSATKLAEFYYNRGYVRELLGRNQDALADGLQALAAGRSALEYHLLWRIQQFVALQHKALGDLKQALAMFDMMAREGNQTNRRGSMVNSMANMARTLLAMGDITQANTYAGRVEALVQEARGSPNPGWRTSYALYGHSWEADADSVRGLVFEARGQYPEAEAAYRRAEAFQRASLKDLSKWDHPAPPEQIMQAADSDLLAIARNESKQGRLSEAEADARRALLGILEQQGKYSPPAPGFIVGLAGVLVEQGRYQEAEKLARSALEVRRALGVGDDARAGANILSQLGNILVLQRKTKEAAVVYAQLDQAIAQWTPERREVLELNSSRIVALYAAGQIDAGIAAAEALVKRETSRTSANSFDTAAAHGTLAVGYARAGRDADAIREFKTAIPVLMAAARENSEDDDPTVVATRNVRLQRIVEAYIGVVARGTNVSNDVAVETFSLADAVRGHAVQQALADSSARAVAKDPALAQLVRTEQDLAKQISAQLGVLNNLLALPSDQRDDQTVRAISAAIDKLRADRKTAQQQINRQFPAYADLVDPKPPTVDAIKASLRPGEALLSFYFGQSASFVWAVPKDGAVAFATVPASAAELATKVHKLREALEPQVAMVSEIPAFNVSLAYELYEALLKPVEPGWRSAKNLIVVTNGALGELPLGLLPTAPSQVAVGTDPLFADYRHVPWLARTHAVTVVPSASALVTLRRLPPGSSDRDKLIGFGDPYFNAQEAADAEAEQQAPVQVAATDSAAAPAVMTRGIPLKLRASPHTEDVDTAELALLPRLPDTRAELTAVAKALDVDPAKALYLGKEANEQNVESANLAHYRIVAFATHGLVPGDLDGLTQPALALTAPEVAGVKGDGLLTMEKILALKLDADWVVLSACNTAAGAGGGAEAASGLGSAFFYAGTRALLVTNWSVHSASARELISDLFRRQSADPSLSRGEALRQAMTALMDGPGFVDASGKTIFTYAHPLFWAPYSVIGDGGGA
ncbi:MAG TPA: CHAT domain-containing tetratricopeptide repeat protein [Xanthobacteraceae bacterium]|nr:CHAT domain-containing tetratricopeptide repeat protein [Xanthobacteraceae bacterium]